MPAVTRLQREKRRNHAIRRWQAAQRELQPTIQNARAGPDVCRTARTDLLIDTRESSDCRRKATSRPGKLGEKLPHLRKTKQSICSCSRSRKQLSHVYKTMTRYLDARAARISSRPKAGRYASFLRLTALAAKQAANAQFASEAVCNMYITHTEHLRCPARAAVRTHT